MARGRHALHAIQNRIGKHFELNGAVAEKTKLALKAVEDFFEKRALQVRSATGDAHIVGPLYCRGPRAAAYYCLVLPSAA